MDCQGHCTKELGLVYCAGWCTDACTYDRYYTLDGSLDDKEATTKKKKTSAKTKAELLVEIDDLRKAMEPSKTALAEQSEQ